MKLKMQNLFERNIVDDVVEERNKDSLEKEGHKMILLLHGSLFNGLDNKSKQK